MSKEVIKLSASWCGPCKQYAPVFQGLVTEMEQAGWVVKMLDIDDAEGIEIASKYGVRGVPATIVLEEGEDVKLQSGAISESQLKYLVGLN